MYELVSLILFVVGICRMMFGDNDILNIIGCSVMLITSALYAIAYAILSLNKNSQL